MELVIMRHGRTAANEQRRYAGSLDVPLSEAGRADCLAAGVVDDVRLVYVSPLLRALQTARICFPQARLVEVDGLQEMNFGDFEGRSADEMEDDPAYRKWVAGACVSACPHGESRDDLTRRCAEAVARIVVDAAERGLERPVIVAHGGTVMGAMNAYVPARRADADEMGYFSWHVGNCEGYRIAVSLVDGTPHFGEYRRFENLSFLM